MGKEKKNVTARTAFTTDSTSIRLAQILRDMVKLTVAKNLIRKHIRFGDLNEFQISRANFQIQVIRNRIGGLFVNAQKIVTSEPGWVPAEIKGLGPTNSNEK